MPANLDASEQAALDVTLRQAIGPATALTGLAYGVSALAHVYAGGEARTTIAPIEAMSFVALSAVGLWLRGRELDPRRAHLVVLGWAAFILLNNFVFLDVHEHVQHPVPLYLLTLGLGMVAGIPLWMYLGLLAGVVAVFSTTLLQLEAPMPQRIEIGLILAASICFSGVLRSWVRTHLSQIRGLHAETQRSEHEREAALVRFREITEMASDLIAELDDQGTILYANPAHEAIFGYDPDDMVGRKFGHYMGTEYAGREKALIDGMLAKPVEAMLVEVTHANGEVRIIELSSRPYLTMNGERRLVVTSHDVTARVTLAAERKRHRVELESLVEERTDALRKSMAELQRRERLAAVGTLAAGIAHQINNPIGGIRLGAEYALGMPEGSEDEAALLREALGSNVREAKRCGAIVKNLLRFARDEPSENEEVELTSLLRDVVELCESYGAQRNAVIDLDLRTPDLRVLGNSVELEQAVINLIRNAIESSDDKVRVQVVLDRRGGDAVIEVQDDGDGMEPEQIDQVFDPFFTTRLTDGGTGLGLSVAHGIASAHGGSLLAFSQPGSGTRMRLTLPVHRSNEVCLLPSSVASPP